MASEKALAGLLAQMRGAWPHAQWDEMTPEMYRLALEPVPDDLLAQAWLATLRSAREYPPPPGVLFEAALDLADGDPTPAEAWALAHRTVASSVLSKDDAPDAVKAAVRAMGGWGVVGDSNPGDAALRARFIQAYQDRKRRDRLAVRAGALALPGPGRNKMLEG